MPEMINLAGRGQPVALAARPISRQEFIAYLQEVGKPIPSQLTHGNRATAPVTDVSQIEATDYCRWLGAKEGRPCRLPRIAELHQLADEMTQEGISSEIWPHYRPPQPEFRGGMKPSYLCEWTQETDTVPQFGNAAPRRSLGSLFYPPWVRQSGNLSHAQAYVAATEGYSFVTFRVATDL